SRRRHTRFSRDWSSDVCSSDLPIALAAERIGLRRCVLTGLAVLAAASMLGAWLDSSLLVLLFRAAEGCGVLMVAMPIPALIRRLDRKRVVEGKSVDPAGSRQHD